MITKLIHTGCRRNEGISNWGIVGIYANQYSSEARSQAFACQDVRTSHNIIYIYNKVRENT